MYHTIAIFLKTSYFHHIDYWIALIVHCNYQKYYIYKKNPVHCTGRKTSIVTFLKNS